MVSGLLLIVILGMLFDNSSSGTEPLYNATDFYQRLSNSRETKRNLISMIKSQSGNSAETEFKSVYKVEFHVVLNAVYDLLVHWGCMHTTIIYEPETGFEFDKLFNFFHQHSLRCQPQLIVESNINMLHHPMFFESRYFVYIGNQHMLAIFTSMSKSSELLSRMRTWIVIGSHHHMSHFESLPLRSFVNSSLSQLTFLIPFSTCCPSPLSMYLAYGLATRVDVYDVFYSLSTLKVEAIPFAYWTSKLRLYFYHQIQDDQGLRGRTVRLITVKGTCPFVCTGGVNNSEILPSFLIDLFDAMKSTLNVNHILELSSQATVGIANPNGSYTGFVGKLYRGEKDIGLMALIVTKERKGAVKYSSMNWNSELTITIKRPLPSIPPTIYVLPLHLSVWLTTGAFFAIAYGLLMLIYRIFIKTNEQSPIEQENAHGQRLIKLDFFEQFIAGDYFSNWPSRVIMITWLIAFLLIFTYYTSILTSVFAFRDTKLPFETMDELAEKSDYCVFTVKDTSYHQAFESAKEGTYKKIWEKLAKDLKRGLVIDFSTAFKEAAKRDKCAFFTNGKPFITIIQKDCKLMYLPNKYLKEHLGFPFRKDFPYIHLYSSRFQRLFEGGTFKRLEKIYINPEPNKCTDTGTSQTLELPQVYMLFVFLLVALSVSIISLVIEKIFLFQKHLFNNKHIKNSIFDRKV